MSEQNMFQSGASTEKPRAIEGQAASTLLEGARQDEIAKGKEAAKAEQNGSIEKLLQEIELLTTEIAEQDEALATAKKALQKSQEIVDADASTQSAGVHEKLIVLRKKEIESALDKKAKLEGRKALAEEIRNGLVN